ncbi:hypothetical protein V8C40DRAFT_281313 [Trichoderma camerunense]
MADRHLYTIGWICAIATELVAALALLDERHDRPKELDLNDLNNYELGRISDHYVAIACLPEGEYGIAAAAEVATNLLRSFPNVRFGLMVGIGGGAPISHYDIRLGDVVVSTPGNNKGGVFYYDFGKTIQNQAFTPTGFLDQPPSLLRTAIVGLKACYEIDGYTLSEEVNEALQKMLRLQKRYSRLQTGDRLYKSTFTHHEDDLVIYYGLIASLNKLMKDAILRDKLAAENDVLCFEMEAAGLMNYFLCLVIRGICDYADTHKNDGWQGFAAMMAAAYARDLLRRLIPEQVQARKKANEALLDLRDQLSELTYNTETIANKLDLAKLSIAYGAESGSYANQYEDECLPGTRTKILYDIEQWATLLQSECIFWLNGMAAKNLLGASFFFKTGEGDCGNAIRFFPTIASQLRNHIPGMVNDLRSVINDKPAILDKPLVEQFQTLILEPMLRLEAASNKNSFLVVVIDALDECENDKDIRAILELFPRVKACNSIRLRIFITSRPELPIRLGFNAMGANDYQDLILHQVPETDIEHDIRLFLEYRFQGIRTTRMLPQDWPGETNMGTLITMSVPLFIFAATMCRMFEDHDLDPQQCLDDFFIYKAEESTLGAIYLPVLNRICAKYSDNNRRKYHFIQDVKEVLSAIILLESPLSLRSLSKLIDIPTEAIRARLNSLHSVLHIPNDETLPIRLFHLSFRDFLLDSETPQKTEIWTDEAITHEKLWNMCLKVMCTYLKKNICGLPNYGVYRKRIATENINQCIPIQLRYSCRYWTHHLMRSHDPTTQSQSVQSFLEKYFLHWVEAMSILAHVLEVTRMLRSLQAITQEYTDDK